MPRLDRPHDSALHWALLLWRIWRRQIAADSETVTVANERRVGVLGAVVRPKCSRNSHVGHETVHHTRDGRCALVPRPVRALEARNAVHEHPSETFAELPCRPRNAAPHRGWQMCSCPASRTGTGSKKRCPRTRRHSASLTVIPGIVPRC